MSIVIVVARDLVGRLLEGVQCIFQLLLRVLYFLCLLGLTTQLSEGSRR